MLGKFLSISQFFKKFKLIENVSLLEIGPVTTNTIIAALQAASEYDFPLFLIASRNQIDKDEFGGGYVHGWDQKRFVAGVKKLAEENGFPQAIYFCRDHGGPWQRDEELNEALAHGESLSRGKSSFFSDIEAGFDILHVDPTKNPFLKDSSDGIKVIIKDTVELIKAAEEKRKLLKMPEVSYEVGTEDIKGGLTQISKFKKFIAELKTHLQNNGLPLPDMVVGQTGTLTKLDGNYGFFQPDTAAQLSGIAKENRCLLKEHNADYLDEETLKMHPVLGISTVNVAPEFGVAETKSLIRLSYLSREGKKFRTRLKESVFSESRWQKWLPENLKDIAGMDFEKNPALSYKIMASCGHYYIEKEDVIKAKREMFRDISRIEGFEPEKEIINSIKQSILKYVKAFNMTNLNKKLEDS
ncbi:MAG: class II D-tagatose-bisphosphate aldolase, non-catalytic subunit [Candidatus Omnitrophica bacterium]|nr:class II D-tagatose-bisphosphate aldolase, non-catalytic subunit [Candidatus Omnitrophota bacterium]